MAYLLGIDIGTSGAKVLAIDEAGKIAARASQEYSLHTPRPLWAEQNPHDWWNAACQCLRQITQQIPAEEIAGIGLSGQDTGQGNTSRAGMLQAQLAVRVVAVDPNGMLQVRGEQNVVINGERQQFLLTGLVRPEDIAADNTITSTRISDATIEFTGQGDVSEAQRRSVLYRLARWLHLI